MHVAALSFARTPHTPVVKQGIAVAIEPPGASPSPPQGCAILGACRLPKDQVLGGGGIDMARAIFLTLAGGDGPHMFTLNLVGDRIVFDDDIQALDDDLVITFRCDLLWRLIFAEPCLLHATLYRHVSNVVWLPG